MYEFKDVISVWDEEMNPNVICCEPLIISVPPKTCIEPLTTPIGSCSEPLMIPLGILSISEYVICDEPLTKPPGIFDKFTFQLNPYHLH